MPDSDVEDAPPAAEDKPRRITKKEKQQTEQLLRELCDLILLCAHTADLENPRFVRHVAPDFKFQWANYPPSATFHDYKSHILGVKASFPNWSMEVLQYTVELQQRLGRAKVWILMKHRNYPEGCEREALNIMSFRRDEEGLWVCYSNYGFPGVAPLPLPLDVAGPVNEFPRAETCEPSSDETASSATPQSDSTAKS